MNTIKTLSALALFFSLNAVVAAQTPAAEDSLTIAGAERMAPLLKLLEDEFTKLHPNVTIEVRGGGSTNGVSLLIKGEASIAALSRPVSKEEVRRAKRKLDCVLVGIPIAMDAVVFLVRRDNPLKSLTLGNVHDLLTYTIRDWQQLNVPFDEVINYRTPHADSGSIKILQTFALKGKGFPKSFSEHATTAELNRTVANDLFAIAFSGMEAANGLKLVPIKGNSGAKPVAPTPETIQTREYAFSHYLYLCFPGHPRGVAGEFLTFILSPTGQEVIRTSRSGAVPLPFIGGKD